MRGFASLSRTLHKPAGRPRMEDMDHGVPPPETVSKHPPAASVERRHGDSHRSIEVPRGGSVWRKMLAFFGPGYLVAVGYMDPGNWATDLAGGSHFGYTLLSVILISNLMAILLQTLSARLGIATGRDLAQTCRDHYSKRVSIALWLVCEAAICACDLAEVIGSAIGLNLLFKIPLVLGVCITALDVLAVMFLQAKGFRYVEAFVVALISVSGLCFCLELVFSRPEVRAVLGGLVPRLEIVRNPEMLYIAIGIIGATVMPHNLYLHSSIVQTRNFEESPAGRREAIRFATLDTMLALFLAFLVNASILVVAAAAFHRVGHRVDEIQDAYKLLTPVLGVGAASTLFALALLASGQSSTLTGTLAGQIVMEGFLQIRLRPAMRRFITRAIAIIPAATVAAIYGESGTAKLLVFSQVILSLQLPFAVIPLVRFTSDPRRMGPFVSPRWVRWLAWVVAAVIVLLNAKLLFDFVGLTGRLDRLFH
jgi:manganese transport protein